MAPATAASTAKKQPLTLAQLSSYDDMLTDALVDRAYYWTTIPKNRPSYHASRGVKEEEITKIIQTHLIVDPDIDLAEQKLLATDGLRRFLSALKTPKQKLDFKQHLRRYTQIYLPDCPFEVSSTNRYTVTTHEASIVARRLIKRNESIKYLSGIQVLITPEEEADLAVRKKDFSIVVSSRNRMASLFMGPARFANHDCGANAKLVITGQAGIDIVAVRSIDVGEEITVTYGENYFGEDNCECLCQTCEDNLVNGWKQPEGFMPVKKSIEGDPAAADQGYNTRGRRRFGRGESRSRTPSITPDVRPKVFKTKITRLLRDGDRASTTDSSFLEGSGSVLKRKRDTETLATPPVTPAKKQRTARYEIAPAPLRTERSSSSEDESGSTSRSESSGGEAGLTDVTTPEDSTDPAEALSKPTLISQAIENLKHEQDLDESTGTGLQEVEPFPGPTDDAPLPVPLLETPRPADRAHSMSIRDILNTPSEAATTPHARTPNNRFGAASSIQAAADTARPREARAESLDPLSTVVVHPASSPPDSAIRGRGRSRNSGMTDLPVREKDSVPTAMNRDDGDPSAVPAIRPSHREPGDYELTPRLLSEPDMAWVRCMICTTAFVQQNAYYTRSSCPRCERHSKLYGYVWPKTQREGPRDKEERVLDHRTIHRFLTLDDELMVRGRASIKRTHTSTPGTDESVPATKRARKRMLMDELAEWTRDSSASATELDVRRSGRRRTASQRVNDDI